MVTLSNVDVHALLLPLPEPHRTASGTITHSPLVLTELQTSEGVTGFSIVFTYTPAALDPVAKLVRNIGTMISGDALAPLAIEQKLASRFRLLGTQGLVGIAMAAIDMAAWDALARSHNVSLVRLLGGAPKPLRAYGAVGFDGEVASAAVAEAWVRKGFTGVKAKIGYPTVAEDLAVIRAMRKAVGPAVHIMVDYNQSLLPATAAERLRRVDDEGLTWIEEPVRAHDYAGHAEVARQIRTPIQCGENWWGIQEMQHSIAAGASDLLMPDVMKIGGVTGWTRAAALAEAHGIPVSNHLWPELSAQLLCVTPTSHWLEYADWWHSLMERPLHMEQGFAIVDEEPGSGVSWTPSTLTKLGG